MLSESEDLVGRTLLGRYRVVTPLGRGGQGLVYLARGEGAAGFARPVVIKRMLARLESDARVLDTFAREARITSQLRHPNIVSVIDFERDGDSYVMVLEYVHGYDLRRWSRFLSNERRDFAADMAGYVLIRVLEALHYAHTLRAPDGAPRRVIHRDISPANVLIDLNGHVKLTDFGVARMDAEEITVVTSGMQIKGKLSYVAPEMYRGAEPSVATDLYACGVMLHELLLGKNEFRSNNALETMRLASDHVGTRVDLVRSDVSKAYADVVERALAKEPEDRFASALEFSQALAQALRSDRTDLEARFREVVREELPRPELAHFLESAQLDELDNAWRHPDLSDYLEPTPRGLFTSLSSADDKRTAAPTALTVIASPLSRRVRDSLAPKLESAQPPAESLRPHKESAPSFPGRPPRFSTQHVLLFAAVCALLAFTLLAFRTLPNDTPRFVYVQRESAAGTATTPAAPQIPQHAPGVGKPRTPSAPSTPEQARALHLSSVFAARRGEVERCFSQYQSELGGLPGMEVELAIDRKGHVTSAALIPATLNNTGFGRCIVSLSLATEFGPQQTALVGRIPITARFVP